MRSSNFDRFMESYFGDAYMAWHDGLDESALLSLEGEEREEAERLLLEALKDGDYRVASGLAALKSQGAIGPLRDEFRTAQGKRLIEIVVALWEAEEYAPAERALIDVLRSDAFWSTRMDAAIALKRVKTEASVDALRSALADPEQLVRHHAAASLLEMYGVHPAFPESHPVTIAIMSDDEEKRHEAAEEILELLRGKSL